MGVQKRIYEAMLLGRPSLRDKAKSVARKMGTTFQGDPPARPPMILRASPPWDFLRTWPRPIDFPEADPDLVAGDLRFRLGTMRAVWASAGYCESEALACLASGKEDDFQHAGSTNLWPGTRRLRGMAKRLRVRFWAEVEELAERFGPEGAAGFARAAMGPQAGARPEDSVPPRPEPTDATIEADREPGDPVQSETPDPDDGPDVSGWGPYPIPSDPPGHHRVHDQCGGSGCPGCRMTGYASMSPQAIRALFNPEPAGPIPGESNPGRESDRGEIRQGFLF